MPFRRLPDSHPVRLTALEAARIKWVASSSGIKLITNAQAEKLDLQNPASLYARYKKEVGDIAPATNLQIAATSAVEIAAHKLRLLVVKSLQNIQSAIEYGDLPPEVRGYYQLPANQETLPSIVNTAAIMLWAERIKTGETARLASGTPAHIGPGPFAWPAIAQINAAASTLEGAQAEQLRAKEKTDTEQEEASALVAEIDTFIKDMWDTIEFNLRTHDAPSLRRRAREWGVFYALRPGEPEETETPVTPPTPPIS